MTVTCLGDNQRFWVEGLYNRRMNRATLFQEYNRSFLFKKFWHVRSINHVPVDLRELHGVHGHGDSIVLKYEYLSTIPEIASSCVW